MQTFTRETVTIDRTGFHRRSLLVLVDGDAPTYAPKARF